MNTGNNQTLLNYIIWHFSTKLKALQGFLNPGDDISNEIGRCKEVLDNPQEELKRWTNDKTSSEGAE